MQSTISVRPATRSDIPGIQRVAQDTWQATYAGMIPDDAISAFVQSNYNPEQLERTLFRLGEGLLVAETGSRIIGYAMVSGDQDGNAQLWAIYVLPELQGRGAGTLLWNAAVERAIATGFSSLCLYVLEGNQQARRFYERQGAKLDGRRDFPVGEESVVEVRYTLDIG